MPHLSRSVHAGATLALCCLGAQAITLVGLTSANQLASIDSSHIGDATYVAVTDVVGNAASNNGSGYAAVAYTNAAIRPGSAPASTALYCINASSDQLMMAPGSSTTRHCRHRPAARGRTEGQRLR